MVPHRLTVLWGFNRSTDPLAPLPGKTRFVRSIFDPHPEYMEIAPASQSNFLPRGLVRDAAPMLLERHDIAYFGQIRGGYEWTLHLRDLDL